MFNIPTHFNLSQPHYYFSVVGRLSFIHSDELFIKAKTHQPKNENMSCRKYREIIP